MSTIRSQFPLSFSGSAGAVRAAPSRTPGPFRGAVRNLLLRPSSRVATFAGRNSFSRQLRPYRVETAESFFELAHCPKCGADAGVFRRRWPLGLVCRDCMEAV